LKSRTYKSGAVLLLLAFSELLEKYLVAGASHGVYSENLISCGFAGCNLTIAYKLPFYGLAIGLYYVWGRAMAGLTKKSLLIWGIPFFIAYTTLFYFIKLIRNIGFIQDHLSYTINVHGGVYLALDWFGDMVFSLIAFLVTFKALEWINRKLINRSTT
jgi:hypothetical protein